MQFIIAQKYKDGIEEERNKSPPTPSSSCMCWTKKSGEEYFTVVGAFDFTRSQPNCSTGSSERDSILGRLKN